MLNHIVINKLSYIYIKLNQTKFELHGQTIDFFTFFSKVTIFLIVLINCKNMLFPKRKST